MKQRSDRLLPPRLQPSVKPAQSAPVSQPQVESPADDVLYGAKQIADFLKLPKVNAVYKLKHQAGAPIGNMPGFGLVASKKALWDWYRQYVPGLAA